MEGDPFTTSHTVKELNAMYEAYAAEKHICCYEFEYNGDYMDKNMPMEDQPVWPIGMGEWEKNPDTEELAMFIADVCAAGTDLIFIGEDGYIWGYNIIPGKVRQIKIEPGDLIYENPKAEHCQKQENQ